MRNVTSNMREQGAERIISNGFVKRGVAHAGTDAQRLAVVDNFIETRDFVDVDKMRGLGEPECHDRHKALPACQHAAVLRCDLGQNLERRRRSVFGTWRMNGAGFMQQTG